MLGVVCSIAISIGSLSMAGQQIRLLYDTGKHAKVSVLSVVGLRLFGKAHTFIIHVYQSLLMCSMYDFRFVEATVMGMDVSQAASVRISAVRAVYEYCEYLKVTSNTQVLLPYMARIMDGILTLATQFSSEVLALVLETLQVVLKVSYRGLWQGLLVGYIQIVQVYVHYHSGYVRIVHPRYNKRIFYEGQLWLQY